MGKTIHYKVAVVGKSQVGKTSLSERFAKGVFTEQRITIGAAMVTRSMPTKNGTAHLVIWDTGGMERYATLVTMYYRDADLVLIVYDMTDASSFDCVLTWLNRIRKFGDPQVIVLVGNKSDLNDRRQVAHDTALHLAQQHGMDYIEVSAKSGHNVEKLFADAVEKLKKLPMEDPPAAPFLEDKKNRCNTC